MIGILELKIMAREKGVKYFSKMSKKELYEAMGMKAPERPTKVEFTNKETGEVLRFPSTYKAAKELGINVGVIYNYTKRVRVGKEIFFVKLYNYKKKT